MLEIFLNQEEDLLGIDRFQDIFITTGKICFCFALLGGISRKHQHGSVFILPAEYSQAFNAVYKRYQKIHEYQIYPGVILFKIINKLLSIAENHNVGSRAFQECFIIPDRWDIVLNNYDPFICQL